MTVTLPMVGEELAGYRLRSVLGRGGMSVVYEAENPRLGSTVALKVLAPELSSDEVFRARFLNESRIAAALNHPNVIPIFDAGPWDGLLFIAMRYVAGSDLRAVLRERGRLTASQTLSLLGQAGRGLDAAHRRGLVHRDVKPANMLIERGADGDPDHVYLADFGITKNALSRSGLTATGQFVGTIDYIAPEQIRDAPVDARTDIYSLGCVFYQCLTGRVPFAKDVDAAVIWAHVEEPPTPPSELLPDAPSGIDAVIAKVLAKDPADRYGTCREFFAAAEACMAPMAGGDPALFTGEPAIGSAQAPGKAAETRVSPPPSPLTATAPAGQGNGGSAGGPGAPPPEQHGGGSSAPPAPPPQTGEPRPHRAPRRRPVLIASVAALVAAGIAVAAWQLSSGKSPAHAASGSSHAQNAILVALKATNESTEAKGLVPPSSCKATSETSVTCTSPSFAIDTATFQTYPSLQALYKAYRDAIKPMENGSIQTNFGECTQRITSGEVSWNHSYQHPRGYSLAQSESGHLTDDQAAGRVFCTFSNSNYMLVWTQNDGRLLASLTGAPHDDAWLWWHGVHHAIVLGGSSSSMNMSTTQSSGSSMSSGSTQSSSGSSMSSGG